MSSNEALCCCEYENSSGERSHILACCCDCEELDQIADRCFKCERIPTSLVDRFIDTFLDRCRLPGIVGGGASKVNLEVATPIFLIPASLAVAAIGPKTTCVVLLILPYFCFFFYRTWKRRTKRARTKFFFVWGLASVFFMYLLFELIICQYTHVSVWDNILLTCSVITMCVCLMYAKKDPGITHGEKVKQYLMESFGCVASFPKPDFRIGGDDSDIEDGFEVIEHSELDGDSRGTTESDPSKPDPCERDQLSGHHGDWCDKCGMDKPDRAGHCSVCGVCVRARDHHCVWIDSCIGVENHRSFLLAMCVFVFTGYYGSYTTLCSVCDPIWPHDVTCPLYVAYRDYKWGLCYAGAWYVAMVTSIMCIGLVHQFFLISQNVTSQELHAASVQGRTKFVLFVDDNPYNRGFVQNWLDFWLKRRIWNSYEIV